MYSVVHAHVQVHYELNLKEARVVCLILKEFFHADDYCSVIRIADALFNEVSLQQL